MSVASVPVPSLEVWWGPEGTREGDTQYHLHNVTYALQYDKRPHPILNSVVKTELEITN